MADAETSMEVESLPPVQQQQEEHVVDVAVANVDSASADAQMQQAGDEEKEEMPFTDDELAVCFKVLDTLARDAKLLDQRNMRIVRKHLAPVAELMEHRKFGGKGRKKYLEDKQLREEKRARQNQRKMHDKRHINSSQLRRERNKKLESLLEQGREVGLPLIADGVAGEDVVHTITAEPLQSLCNDDATQQKEEQLAEEKREASALLGFRSCYTCKSRFDKIHQFYDQLCPRCADLNFLKRFQTSDLRGKVALITGARVKIGFQTAVKLLLAGAAVIATTRFPTDAAERFAQHPEYETFKDRLQIFGIDFRDLIHLEQFLDFVLTRYSRLDIVIHNACQTIRRPPKYYEHLVQKEMQSLEQSAKSVQLLMHHQQEFQSHVKSLSLEGGGADSTSTSTAASSFAMSSALKSQVPLIASDEQDASAFPDGMVDVNGQQIDLRSKNTWLLKIGEVETPEVAEVFAINTLAPFIMNNRLVPLLERNMGPQERKFIVNVSAMEGKFYRYKTPNHPHTNMAKAALNMMTRTCAEDLSKRRIYMNSVDTGWINDENPLQKAHAHAVNSDFQTPIDEIDAAARILDPVFVGFNEADKKAVFGKFLKDFHETEWFIFLPFVLFLAGPIFDIFILPTESNSSKESNSLLFKLLAAVFERPARRKQSSSVPPTLTYSHSHSIFPFRSPPQPARGSSFPNLPRSAHVVEFVPSLAPSLQPPRLQTTSKTMKGDTRVDNEKYDLPAGSQVTLANHPVLHHKLTKLRDERTDSNLFRHVLREVTFYLGYEATFDLETIPKKIKTPIADHEGAELSTKVAVVPILRAGLGMVEPMLDLLPNAAVHHIGMYRNKHSLLPVQYYNKLPKECNVDVAIVLEPVIATAGTIIATVAILKTWGVPKIKIVSTIASKQGLQDLFSNHPEVEVFLGAIDDALTEEGYIFPGLGDAGDREFQTGIHQDDNYKRQKL